MTAIAKDSFSELEGHQQIPELLREFEDVSDLAAGMSQLVVLREMLEEHFAEEERTGGFFEELCSVQPGNVSRVKELTEEHGEILGQADALHSGLDGMTFEQAVPKIAELCEAIRRHHQCEHQLFLDSYLVDHGGGS